MVDDEINKMLIDALFSRACGYKCEDINEEFVFDSAGSSNLSKKKINRKTYPPDITAITKMMDIINPHPVDYDAMSDEQLDSLKQDIEDDLFDE